MPKKENYTGEQIQVLEGLDPVRKRPGMYIGSTDKRGLHHLIWEVVDNAVDEHLAGFCNKIKIELNKDGSVSVEDNGRGMPIDLHSNTRDYPKNKYPNGICTERIILTVLHSGGKFDGGAYKVSGGLHGVGISVVNALSKYVCVEVFKDGKHYKDEYENGGIATTKLNKGELLPIGDTDKNGTKITFIPDDTIFETVHFKADTIRRRLKETAYLNKNLTLEFIDYTKDEPETEIFHDDRGIIGFVADLNKDKEIIHDDIVYIEGENNGQYFECAFQLTNDFGETIYSFCNNIITTEGGTHETGFKSALTKIVNKYAKDLGLLKAKDGAIDGKDLRNGLTAVLSLKHHDPQFEGQTKSKLGSSDAKLAVEAIMTEWLPIYFDKNVTTVEKIIEQSLKMAGLRKNETKARDAFMKKNNQNSISSKLASCSLSNNPDKGIRTEIFLVEGDSAAGSAKTARDRKIQSILPVFGKILNTEKCPVESVYGNEKLAPFITAIGCGIGDDFDITKLKYDKIIIMSDADVDGAHIATLWLTFFYRFMPELIKEGHVYCSCPPLYKVTYNKKSQYIQTKPELDKFLKGKKNVSIQRFKGLGEMSADQLWETTMNPATRILKRITIDDLKDASDTVSLLMGSEVPPRRDFIIRNSKILAEN